MAAIDINHFCLSCGFFTPDTPVNNGYGCNHEKQKETEIIKISNPDVRPDNEYFKYKIIRVFLRKKYGSYAEIVNALETKEGKEYWDRCLNDFIYDQKKLKEIGLKRQGKCYAFSCPIASESEEFENCVIPIN